VSLICCCRTERGKACPDTVTRVVVATGSAPSSGNCEALSTDAGRAGGPACSSDEAAVMAAEQRGRPSRLLMRSTGQVREEPGESAKAVTKVVRDF
jgi:hypothetical protein